MEKINKKLSPIKEISQLNPPLHQISPIKRTENVSFSGQYIHKVMIESSSTFSDDSAFEANVISTQENCLLSDNTHIIQSTPRSFIDKLSLDVLYSQEINTFINDERSFDDETISVLNTAKNSSSQFNMTQSSLNIETSTLLVSSTHTTFSSNTTNTSQLQLNQDINNIEDQTQQ